MPACLGGSIVHDGPIASGPCSRSASRGRPRPGALGRTRTARLAGYEDVNDAERLAHDPAMRTVVHRTGLDRQAPSTSQMGHLRSDSNHRPMTLAAGVLPALSPLQELSDGAWCACQMGGWAGRRGNVGSRPLTPKQDQAQIATTAGRG
jgi:hypothetical protein